MMPILSIAGNNTGLIQSTAKIDPTCLISTNDVNVGIINDEDLVSFRQFTQKVKIAESKLNLKCTKHTNILIYQNGGIYFDGNANYLKHTTLNQFLLYAFHTEDLISNSDFTITRVPENNHIHRNRYIQITNSHGNNFNINFKIAIFFPLNTAKQYAPGIYSDTVTYNVYF